MFRHVRMVPAGEAGLVALALDAAVLAESAGPSRAFADVRVIDPEGRQVPYFVERRGEPLSFDQKLAPAIALGGPDGCRPAGRLPHHAAGSQSCPNRGSCSRPTRGCSIDASCSGSSGRPDRQRRDPWLEEISSGRWVHADRERAASAFLLALRQVDATELLLVVDEGDNQALAIGTPRCCSRGTGCGFIVRPARRFVSPRAR